MPNDGLYQRTEGGIWWVDISIEGQPRIRRSTKTKNRKAAREFHDRLKADLWRQVKLKEKPDYLWDDGAMKWIEENHHLESFENRIIQLRKLDPHLAGIKLKDIDRDLVDEVVAQLDVSDSTRNRYTSLIRRILNCAYREWQWIDHVPALRIRKEPEPDDTFLRKEHEQRLVNACPKHIKPVVQFALATGLRKSNILKLKWEQIDLERRVAWKSIGQMKARKKALGIPLNDAAIEVLKGQEGLHEERVFIYKGKPFDSISNATWKATVEKAQLPYYLKFHGLRHTWASWHVISGTDTRSLQEMGDWSSMKVVERYTHLNPQHLLETSQNLLRDPSVASKLSDLTPEEFMEKLQEKIVDTILAQKGNEGAGSLDEK